MEFDVTIEIPGGSRNKYEVDHVTGRLKLDRMLFTSTRYPHDYGFVDNTLGEDGDPLDCLVLVAEPTFPGCLIRCRTIGMFRMTDEAGGDDKLICVPVADPVWSICATSTTWRSSTGSRCSTSSRCTRTSNPASPSKGPPGRAATPPRRRCSRPSRATRNRATASRPVLRSCRQKAIPKRSNGHFGEAQHADSHGVGSAWTGGLEDLLSAVPGQQVLLWLPDADGTLQLSGSRGIEHSAQATPDAAAGLSTPRRCSYGPRPTPISRPERCWQ